MARSPSIVDLVGDVARESADLVSAELTRMRAEVDERAEHASRLAVFSGIAITLVALSLQAFAVAAIVACWELTGSWTLSASLVGTLFLVLALLFGFAVRRSARLTREPLKLEGPDRIDRPALPAGTSAEESP